MRRTKFFGWLLALAIVVLAAGLVCAAEVALPLRLDANTSQNGTGWRWDAASRTLTLQNTQLFVSAGTDGSARTVHIACDATIALSGKNTIRAGDASADGAQSWALVVDGACTVTGDGDLTLVSGRATGEGGQSVALLTAGALDFAGTGSIRAFSGAADYSCAVSGLSDVTFTSGCVSMNGGDFACVAANDSTIALPPRAQVVGAVRTVPRAARRSGRSTFFVSGEPAAQVQVAAPGAVSGAGLFFEDVGADDWFCGDVGYVLQAGLMSGTSRTQFSPDRTTTRGMIVTILYRLAGAPAVNTAAPYTDVAPDSYCADAAAWAAQTGVAAGIGGGRFAPQRGITRAELAAMLCRFAKWQGGVANSVAKIAAETAFTDAAQIPEYAREAAAWAAENGLIRGSAGQFLPSQNATRAQTAAILHRLSELKTDK